MANEWGEWAVLGNVAGQCEWTGLEPWRRWKVSSGEADAGPLVGLACPKRRRTHSSGRGLSPPGYPTSSTPYLLCICTMYMYSTYIQSSAYIYLLGTRLGHTI